MPQLANPLDAFLQAAQQKNQNRQNMYQNIAGIGQGLGTIADQLQDLQKKKQWQQTINSLMQNPNLSPQMKAYLPMIAQQPELMGQLGPSLLKSQNTSANQNATPDQASAFLGNSPEAQKFLSTMGTQIPWNVLGKEKTALSQAGMLKDRDVWANSLQQRTDLQKENVLYQNLNSLNQSSGGLLGQAGGIQYRAQRGKELLTNPNIKTDARVYGLVQADLAAIAKGGTPDLATQAEANLPNYGQKANALLQQITAHPESINQPQVKQQLLSIFDAMDKGAGNIIDQNTAGVLDIFGEDPWVKAHPQAVRKAIQAIGRGIKPMNPKDLPPLMSPPSGAVSYDSSNEDLLNYIQGNQ